MIALYEDTILNFSCIHEQTLQLLQVLRAVLNESEERFIFLMFSKLFNNKSNVVKYLKQSLNVT